MKNTFVTLFLIVASLVAMVGCSDYNKVLKSTDYRKAYLMGVDYFNQGKYEKALSLFDHVQPAMVGTLGEDSLSYYMATSYYKMGDFTTSSDLFDSFRRRFGRSAFLEDVEYMYAMGYYFASPDPQWDQTPTRMGIAAITEYLAHYPESVKRDLCLERINELQYKLYEKSFQNARTYFKIENYRSAIVAIKNALNEYPETPFREELLYLNTVASYKLASNSIASMQTDRYLSMLDHYYNLISEFPYTEHRKEVDKMQAEAKEYLESRDIDTDETELNKENDAD
ncbi:MAG: outer membrane protein assembly factor BamD [Tidjanibacter sp.]|nr:outer membrane protein assembly factor BamD [Tidjanibacter sp.]